MRPALLAAALLATGSGPVGAAEDELREVQRAVKTMAKMLASGLQGKKGKVGVLSFSPVADGTATSPFGQMLQESLSAELAARRRKAAYEVVERREIYKIMEDSRLFGKDEELFDKLREKVGMDFVVSGSYAHTEKEVTVTAGLLNSASGVVEASARALIPNGPGLARMLKSNAPSGGGEAQAPDKLSLDLAVVYLGADGKLHPVREGTVMTSQDHYAVYLKPAQACHVYIYQVDAAGDTIRLFPNAQFQTRANPLEPGAEAWAPNDRSFYFLDETKGTETIYVIASRESQEALESLVTARKEEFSDKVKGLKLMGVGGARNLSVVKAAPLKGSAADILSRQLGAASDFVYSVSFQHR